MTQEEIKSLCERLYKAIQDSQDGLKELRSICKHPNTFNGLYSWRIGSECNALICSDCGTMVQNLDIPIIETT